MFDLFNQWNNDIDWSAIGNQGRKLSQVARRNLIFISTICAIGGSVSAGVGLVGNYSPRASYCDPRTKPCTKVEVSLDQLPLDLKPEILPGYGLQRTATSVLAVVFFGAGLLAVAKAEEEQEELEPQIQLDKQLEIKQLELEANEQLQNLENLSQIRTETHEQELREAQAELFFERNPHMIQEYLPKKVEPELSEPTEEKLPVIEETKSEPESETKKIPPGIEMMLDSDLREVVDAGILNLVGAQGSGKTTTSCMLLRYRVWKEHKLIIINPHKKKAMYRGLESHLLHGTEFYGVGQGDEDRAFSLLRGLDKVLKTISDRYDEYQNLNEDEYQHFPITILLEESAEYDGLLSIFNRPSDKQTGDPGFSAKKYLTLFWKKFFIATRKGNCFGIRTLQFDSNTMNGTEGMAELIKSQGACTLTQYSVPDGQCVGGWRSTGEAEIKIPNQLGEDGKVIDGKRGKVPTWFDYKKVLDPSDFQDLVAVIHSKSERLNTVVKIDTEKTLSNDSTVQNLESNTQSPITDDLDPDELLRQNIDRIINNFERSLTYSPSSEDVNSRDSQPEATELEEQPKSIGPQPQPQISGGEAGEKSVKKRYTPLQLTKTEIIAIVSKMRSDGMSQTKIIEQLWKVKKSRTGWSTAYREFTKDLGL